MFGYKPFSNSSDPSNEFIIFRDDTNDCLNLGRRKKKEKEKPQIARPDDPIPRSELSVPY